MGADGAVRSPPGARSPPDALTACGRVFVEEIARFQKREEKGGETGAAHLSEPHEDERARAAAKGPWVGEASGFNVHAGVTVRAGDGEGLERLLRYCARPPFSLERLSLLPDGRVAYLLRKPRRNGATHLVMTPVQLLARISALIPPPRFPLLRLSGVFAPRSSWRAAVVPKTPATRRRRRRARRRRSARLPRRSPRAARGGIRARPRERVRGAARGRASATASSGRSARGSTGRAFCGACIWRMSWRALVAVAARSSPTSRSRRSSSPSSRT